MRYILFDVDGVLIHTEMWSSEFIRRNNLPPDSMKDFFAGVFRDCTLGKADLRDILPPFLMKWGYQYGVDAFLEEWFEYENHPDIELIEKIQILRKSGTHCYVATNQEKYRLAYLRDEMKFDEYFDGVYCSAEIGLKKPDKSYYESILKSLDVLAEEVLYFDDSLENIEVANELGIRSVYYRSIDDFTRAIQ